MNAEPNDVAAVQAGYTFAGPSISLGAVLVDGQPAAQVGMPLSMMNRHGLVSGVTGTGKTKTLRSAGTALGREITRSVLGTAKKTSRKR